MDDPTPLLDGRDTPDAVDAAHPPRPPAPEPTPPSPRLPTPPDALETVARQLALGMRARVGADAHTDPSPPRDGWPPHLACVLRPRAGANGTATLTLPGTRTEAHTHRLAAGETKTFVTRARSVVLVVDGECTESVTPRDPTRGRRGPSGDTPPRPPRVWRTNEDGTARPVEPRAQPPAPTADDAAHDTPPPEPRPGPPVDATGATPTLWRHAASPRDWWCETPATRTVRALTPTLLVFAERDNAR